MSTIKTIKTIKIFFNKTFFVVAFCIKNVYNTNDVKTIIIKTDEFMKKIMYVTFDILQFDETTNEREKFITFLYENKNVRVLRNDDYYENEMMIRAKQNHVLKFVLDVNDFLKTDFVFSIYEHKTKTHFLNFDYENECFDENIENIENDCIDSFVECISFFKIEKHIFKIDEKQSRVQLIASKRNLTNFCKHHLNNVDLIDDIKTLI